MRLRILQVLRNKNTAMRMLDCYIECKGAVDATYPSEWIGSYTVKACCSDNWGMLTPSYKVHASLKVTKSSTEHG